MPTPSDQNLQRVLDRVIVAVIRAESPDLLVDVAEVAVEADSQLLGPLRHSGTPSSSAAHPFNRL